MKKITLYLLILLVSLSIKGQPPVSSNNGETNYQIGIKLLQEGRAADALPYLQAAVKINRESYLYRLNAGRAAQFSENYQPCIENLTEAMRLRPKEQTEQAFYLWRAECYAELGNQTEAARDFAKAVELQPGLKLAYSTRIFYDTGNVCRGSADSKYREAEAFYNANKIYEAYRDLYVALKCDAKHLPSLKLRLKIESADQNLSTHAKIHRAQFEKIERANSSAGNKSTRVSDENDDPNSDDFLDKVFDVKKIAPISPSAKPGSGVLLNKYLAQIEQMFAGQPVITRSATSPVNSSLGGNLYGAVFWGKTQLALDLIKQGADVNYQSVTEFGYKKSVLAEAVEQKNLRLVKALLEAGADPNGDFRLKMIPPIASAISANNTLMVALLIKYKVDVNGLYNFEPTTFLMAAAYPEKEEISKLLIEAGADETAKNSKGETARQITERIKREKAAEVPPTASELRGYRIKMIDLTHKGTNSRVEKFNKHMDLFKEVSSALLNDRKISYLNDGIGYLDEIINSATEAEKTAALLFGDPALAPQIRPSLQSKMSDIVKAKEDAVKLKKTLQEARTKLQGFR